MVSTNYASEKKRKEEEFTFSACFLHLGRGWPQGQVPVGRANESGLAFMSSVTDMT